VREKRGCLGREGTWCGTEAVVGGEVGRVAADCRTSPGSAWYLGEGRGNVRERDGVRFLILFHLFNSI
jgi:hypothetical protein